MVSEPYVTMTLAMLKDWGYTVFQEPTVTRFPLPSPPKIPLTPLSPMPRPASYFWAAAAVTGGDVTVPV